MTSPAQRPYDGRMVFVAVCLGFGFALFLAKAYWLQVVKADDHLARAQWGVESVAEYRAPRGAITDRDGALLAQSAPAVQIEFDPRLLLTDDRDQLEAVVAELSRYPRFNAEELRAWQNVAPADVPRWRLVAYGVAPAEADALRERLNALGVRSVMMREGFRRVYPNDDLAGRAIGFLDAAGEAGVAGLELAFEDALRGGTIEVRVARDAAREPYLLDEVPDLDDAAGATVELTLDSELQAVAENELDATLEAFQAEAGVAIVSRVGTGEILAMATRPGFDREHALDAGGTAWQNPAIGSVFEPGSTAKMFTFAAALEEGVVRYDTEFDCENGVVMVDRYPIRDRHCHDSILAWEVIRESSNIGALRMGMRIPQERHRAYLRAFGFGERTALRLPGETAGVVPTLERPWADSRHATISYGYGFSVTALQLNMATATIANGGVRMHPYLVRRVVGPGGVVLEETEPEVAMRVVSERTAELTTQALETVVSREGTAYLASVPGYRVAGKTGTARLLAPGGGYEENAYLAAFSGYLPADEPRFAITVMVTRPDPSIGYYGGVVAAPVFAGIARRALEIDGLPVEIPTERPPVEHVAAAEVTEGIAEVAAPPVDGIRRVPNLTGMSPREALAAAAREGLSVAVEGTGSVASQWPPAGSPASPGLVVVLTMEDPTR